MKMLIITTVVLAATFAAGSAQAGIFGGRRCAPAGPPVVYAPAPVATAQATAGYRSFSYEPGPVYAAPRYVTPARQPVVGSGFHDAGWKIRGGY